MELHISSVDDLVQDSFDPDPPSLANEDSVVSTQQNPHLQVKGVQDQKNPAQDCQLRIC